MSRAFERGDDGFVSHWIQCSKSTLFAEEGFDLKNQLSCSTCKAINKSYTVEEKKVKKKQRPNEEVSRKPQQKKKRKEKEGTKKKPEKWLFYQTPLHVGQGLSI